MARIIPTDRIDGLWSAARGLTATEVTDKRSRFGQNFVVESVPHRWRTLVADTAKDPMLWFFAATSGVYWVVGQRTEAITLLAAIAPLLGMDFYLHRRTQASTEGLRSRLSVRARVSRDGQETTIATTELVPGDLVILGTADTVPADGVVLESHEIQVEESALTGEAYPVKKHSGRAEAASLDDEHWVFAGTKILTGEARVRIVYTGGETIYGEIVRSTIQGPHESTPLQKAIRDLVKRLLLGAIVLCGLLAIVRLRQGQGWLDALVSAVTLATAAIPEEFPVIFTFFLGLGVYRLAKHQALVRRAVTVENIGRISCICTDKTGTLTEGRLRLAHVLPAPGFTESRLLRLARIASRPESGDPLDEAILQFGGKAEPGPAIPTRAQIFPFTEERKRETSIVTEDGHLLAACKGATEIVLAMSNISDQAVRAHWLMTSDQFAGSAHKVIAIAEGRLDSGNPIVEPETDLIFAGLLAFEDPIRDGVREAVRTCQRAGIHPIMVTGDHALTAQAVAREIGLDGSAPRCLSGDDLEDTLKRGQAPELRNIDVIARARPAQKLLLVQTLKSAHEIVAVTGDGVNDVPALQAADIGFAMGERGTRSAREAASIVLLNDNFRTIVRAIGEGRQLFRNLRLSFHYLLVVHIPLVLTAALIPLAGYPLLYLPTHIVWLEMIIHPTAMLAFQSLAPKELVPPELGRGPTQFFLGSEWLHIALSGLVATAVVAAGFLHALYDSGSVESGRAMALAALITTGSMVAAAVSRLRTRAARVVCAATLTFSIVLIQVPAISHLLHLRPLRLEDWALAVLGGSIAACISWRGTSSREH